MSQNTLLEAPYITGKKPILYCILAAIWVVGLCAGVLSVIYLRDRYFTFLITCFIISCFIWMVGNLFIKSYTIIGKLELYPDLILINGLNDRESFNIRDIEHVRVTYYGTKGDSFGVRVGLFRVKNGAHNHLSFNHKGCNYDFQFLVTAPKDIFLLKSLLATWQQENRNLKIIVLNEYKDDITSKFIREAHDKRNIAPLSGHL